MFDGSGFYALGRLLEDSKEKKDLVFVQGKAAPAGERLSWLMVESSVVEVTVLAMKNHQDTVTTNNSCLLIQHLISLSVTAKDLIHRHNVVHHVMEGMEHNEQDGELLAFGDCVEDTEMLPSVLERIISWVSSFASKLNMNDKLLLDYCTLVRKISQIPGNGVEPASPQHLARQQLIADSGVMAKMVEIIDYINQEEESKNEFEPLTFIRSAELNESVRCVHNLIKFNTRTQLGFISLNGFDAINRTLERYDEVNDLAFKFLYDEDKTCRTTCISLLSSLFDGENRHGRHEQLLQTDSGVEMAQIAMQWMLSVAHTSGQVQAVHERATQWGLSLEE
eukprot:258680-Hanusia_phi.AAC.2